MKASLSHETRVHQLIQRARTTQQPVITQVLPYHYIPPTYAYQSDQENILEKKNWKVQ